MIVNYFEPATSFELPPQQAINYFVDKGLRPTFNWSEMLNEQHDRAFTIAKMMDIDLLETVRQAVEDAIANGTTLAEFRTTLIPELQKKGWWGKKDVIDPNTGRVVSAQLGSASRLETIFRTNLQSSYAAGHWQGIQDAKDIAPFLMYDAVDDHRTRSEHKAFDNTVLPVDHPFWQTNFPPNGWNCRCGAIQMDADDLEEFGLKVSDGKFDQTKKWTNPTTGETVKVPVGTDPGFSHNPGINELSKLQERQAEKLSKLPTESAQAARVGIAASMQRAQAKKDAQKAIQAESTSQTAIDKARARTFVTRELDSIMDGDDVLKQSALRRARENGIHEDDPVALLAHVLDEAKQEEARITKAAAITGYTAAILDGKMPTAEQRETFAKLDREEKRAVIDEIEQGVTESKNAGVKLTDGDVPNLTDLQIESADGALASANFYIDKQTGKRYYVQVIEKEEGGFTINLVELD